jgi:hypothetical protein
MPAGILRARASCRRGRRPGSAYPTRFSGGSPADSRRHVALEPAPGEDDGCRAGRDEPHVRASFCSAPGGRRRPRRAARVIAPARRGRDGSDERRRPDAGEPPRPAAPPPPPPPPRSNRAVTDSPARAWPGTGSETCGRRRWPTAALARAEARTRSREHEWPDAEHEMRTSGRPSGGASMPSALGGEGAHRLDTRVGSAARSSPDQIDAATRQRNTISVATTHAAAAARPGDGQRGDGSPPHPKESASATGKPRGRERRCLAGQGEAPRIAPERHRAGAFRRRIEYDRAPRAPRRNRRPVAPKPSRPKQTCNGTRRGRTTRRARTPRPRAAIRPAKPGRHDSGGGGSPHGSGRRRAA